MVFGLTGRVEWDGAVYELEGGWDKESGEHSTRWHGAEEVGVLTIFLNPLFCFSVKNYDKSLNISFFWFLLEFVFYILLLCYE